MATTGYVQTRRALGEADANFQMARGAVDEMLTVVGQDHLANVP